MESVTRLALLSILTGLRQTGAIDRRAVRSIATTMRSFASQAKVRCADTAEELNALAELLEEGPARSFCHILPDGATNGAAPIDAHAATSAPRDDDRAPRPR